MSAVAHLSDYLARQCAVVRTARC